VSPRQLIVDILVLLALILAAPTAALAQQPADPPREATTLAPPKPQNYGAMLLRMILGVLVVCVAAFLVLKYGVQRFVSPNASADHFEVLARFPIEPRRSLIVARVASKTLLLSSSEAGIHLVRELDPEDAASFGVTTADTFQKPAFTLDVAPELEVEASEE